MFDYDRDEVGAERIGMEWRVARRPHVCACGGTIRKGTRYAREFWVVDGAADTVKIAEHIHTFEYEAAAQAAYENQF
jgi:hypothetical protein